MSSSPTSSSSSETLSALPDAYRAFAAVPCDVDIMLGAGEISVRDCLSLQKGSIVELDQSAGQDLTLVVNGLPFGRAEVVIMDDSVSVRITELSRSKGETR